MAETKQKYRVTTVTHCDKCGETSTYTHEGYGFNLDRFEVMLNMKDTVSITVEKVC